MPLITKIKITIIAGVIFITAIFLGVWSEATHKPPATWLREMGSSLKNLKANHDVSITGKNRDDHCIKIPLRYNSLHSQPLLYRDIPIEFISVPSSKVALVLVDMWNTFDTPLGQPPDPYMKRVQEALHWARENNVLVIHAPNFPVVQKYNNYFLLKKEISKYLSKNNLSPYKNDIADREYFAWPPYHHDLKKQAIAIRAHHDKIVERSTSSSENGFISQSISDKDLDISRFLTPIDNEYVVESYEEFRYVLWKEKIFVLLYGGGALNICMLQRETGINRLAGITSQRKGFLIVLLEDIIHSCPRPPFLPQQITDVMLNYLSISTVHISSIKEIIESSKPSPLPSPQGIY